MQCHFSQCGKMTRARGPIAFQILDFRPGSDKNSQVMFWSGSGMAFLACCCVVQQPEVCYLRDSSWTQHRILVRFQADVVKIQLKPGRMKKIKQNVSSGKPMFTFGPCGIRVKTQAVCKITMTACHEAPASGSGSINKRHKQSESLLDSGKAWLLLSWTWDG